MRAKRRAGAHRSALRALIVIAGAAWIGAVCAAPAYGWTFSGGNGASLFVARESSDSVDATAVVYRNSGGASSAHYLNGSYLSTVAGGLFVPLRAYATTVTIPAEVRYVSVPVLPSYAYLVVMSDGSKAYYGPGFAQPVYLSQYASVLPTSSNAVSVVGTVAAAITSMSADTTMSVAGTLPVSVTAIGGVESGGLDVAFAAVFVVAGCAIGWAVRP